MGMGGGMGMGMGGGMGMGMGMGGGIGGGMGGGMGGNIQFSGNPFDNPQASGLAPMPKKDPTSIDGLDIFGK